MGTWEPAALLYIRKVFSTVVSCHWAVHGRQAGMPCFLSALLWVSFFTKVEGQIVWLWMSWGMLLWVSHCVLSTWYVICPHATDPTVPLRGGCRGWGSFFSFMPLCRGSITKVRESIPETFLTRLPRKRRVVEGNGVPSVQLLFSSVWTTCWWSYLCVQCDLPGFFPSRWRHQHGVPNHGNLE